jgi:hypothetical protein
VNEGVNISKLPLGGKFTPRGQVHPYIGAIFIPKGKTHVVKTGLCGSFDI